MRVLWLAEAIQLAIFTGQEHYANLTAQGVSFSFLPEAELPKIFPFIKKGGDGEVPRT